MRTAKRTLKHAELYLLRDAELWRSEPKTWADAQELLRGLRIQLSKIEQIPTPDCGALNL